MTHKHVQQNSALNQSQTSVSIVGARGYTGLELAKILFHHPGVKLTKAFATKAFRLSDDLLETEAKHVECLTDSEILQNLTDVVFLATPAEVSLKLAPEVLAKGSKVIDLSGAFRLKKEDYQRWYGFEHTQSALLKQAHYGLVPFSGPVKSETQLIANPGCYATAISMALVPLMKKNLIDPKTLVIDAKSGTSGAGRKAAENLLFTEVDGNCLPYRVGRHQHTPEIQECLEAATGSWIDPHFATHLLATPRGIIASIYAATTAKDAATVTQAYEEAFGDYPFVRFGTNISKLASLQKIVNTPFTHISYEVVDGKLYVFSCIDNLMKGAASQAVENLNRMMDWPVTLGLKDPKETK